jgi:hypothetical protein
MTNKVVSTPTPNILGKIDPAYDPAHIKAAKKDESKNHHPRTVQPHVDKNPPKEHKHHGASREIKSQRTQMKQK